MNYQEAIEIDGITPDEAKIEIEKHSASWGEFLEEVGHKDTYTGEEILGWLGY